MTGDGATTGGGGIPALGVAPYSWNTEALHGLAGACLTMGGVRTDGAEPPLPPLLPPRPPHVYPTTLTIPPAF